MHSLPHPIMLYYKRANSASYIKKSPNENHFSLEIIGSPSSICEAIIIKTAYSILKDQGFDDIYIDINSIGDKDSVARFERELHYYLKKNIDSVPAEYKSIFKKDVFEILRCEDEKCKALRENAPKSVSFLSEPSIQHFKEVLEYLETLDIPYRINNNLISNKHCCCQTIFEIKKTGEETEEVSLACGTRYSYLSKKIGFKKDIPIISLSIRYKKREQTAQKPLIKNRLKPKFYFIQLGFRAKLKSLAVIESLRKAKIAVHHSLTRDKFVAQLGAAENMKLPFVIIMGQKEALDNTVVVRNIYTREQETVDVSELPTYLSNLRH
jgi:histidyl-tRNA synthetase